MTTVIIFICTIAVLVLIGYGMYNLGRNEGYCEGRNKANYDWSRVIDRLCGDEFVRRNRLTLGFHYYPDQDKG